MEHALVSLQQWATHRLPFGKRRDSLTRHLRTIATISETRLRASLNDTPVDIPSFLADAHSGKISQEATVLYLGYGSNLSAETFLGKRQIHPISQLNVVVPSISLAFDLPGIPYIEPCFANSNYRQPLEASKSPVQSNDYHKDRWHKGLVGVVYEVTKQDYAHIIATEGGGAGYQDVLVDCFSLDPNPRAVVPTEPSGTPFRAHTLLAPPRSTRPEHSYAQPSARYLKLVTDGAAEHSLPYEYQDFLHQIRSFRITTQKQRLGLFIFSMIWVPLFAFVFQGGGAIFVKPDGTFPTWFANLCTAIFTACWKSYDKFFKPMFGDGERTIGDDESDEAVDRSLDEKAPLIRDTIRRYGRPANLNIV